MSDDAIRWDDKYRKRENTEFPKPDPFLIDYLELFKPDQRVVDLASGRGRHSLLLAAQGCYMIPIDCSRIALHRSTSEANVRGLAIHPIVADLADFRLPSQSLDAIICFNYLNRELSENICDALVPGGYFLMKTFNRNFLKKNPKFNPNYVLAPGELTTMFGRLDMIFLRDDCLDSSQTSSAIVATKA